MLLRTAIEERNMMRGVSLFQAIIFLALFSSHVLVGRDECTPPMGPPCEQGESSCVKYFDDTLGSIKCCGTYCDSQGYLCNRIETGSNPTLQRCACLYPAGPGVYEITIPPCNITAEYVNGVFLDLYCDNNDQCPGSLTGCMLVKYAVYFCCCG